MNSAPRWRRPVVIAALSLLYLPLRAAEAPPAPPPAAEERRQTPPSPPPAPADDAEEAAPVEKPPAADEGESRGRISADNSLSFPVDI
jgi:hypothetical protein